VKVELWSEGWRGESRGIGGGVEDKQERREEW